MVQVNGSAHGYWEITVTLENIAKLEGISFKSASEKLPYNTRVYVTDDPSEWKQVGSAYDTKLKLSTSYYFVPDNVINAKYVKVIFSDCQTGAGLSNISLFGETIDIGRIPNSDITLIEGPKTGEHEGYEKMFDDNLSTKFYIRLYPDNETPANLDPVAPIYFSTSVPVTILTYHLTTANDNEKFPYRIPRKWTLYASVDGQEDSYVIIDHVTDPKIAAINCKTYTYTVANPGEYQYYKLVFDTVDTTGNMQFSEIAFFEEIW